MKVCTSCKQSKPRSEYNKHSKRKDGLQTVCKGCNRSRSRQYYKDNKVKHKSVVRARQKSLREEQARLLKEHKESMPCKDCGRYYPSYVMDFDHKRDKSIIVSSMPGSFSTKRIWEEIEKCELVCSNCHRIRTHSTGL